MTRWMVGLAALAGGGVAQAQVYGAPGATGGFGGGAGYGGQGTGNLAGAFAPNFYNRNQQPLSPYLNLARGGNPAVNYFYGTRPGLGSSASGMAGGFGFQGANLGPPGAGNRFYLQPPPGDGELPYQPFEASRELGVIPTAAHLVTFGNGPGSGLRSPTRTGFGAQQPASRPATTPRR